ncbi:Gfo/Idh/MocA family oxidoreductase [Actinotalea ferrariae]|uniref:Gfo/Idh/MocA family protein n=1 Tax=Actinotalea ferrariae TaxID=1386098 RepID=UPI001C8B73EC|nr:Gfo/Idh/MocA family oxidoreductase [Actinotalea ferrariae]MBX9246167.1 Gfo/Idh/MocA family oxidoreductase [Actinotalea ferrariae]
MAQEDRELRPRVGLVGYGDAGRGIHARLLREAGQVVTDVVTRDPGRAAAAAEDWPDVRVHGDLDALLAADVDVVVIASPTGRHVEHATATLEAGVATVVDKPLALDREGARGLVELADARGGRLTVFQNRRWDAEQLTLGRLLAEGTLGDVHRFERRWERWRPVPKDRWKENAVGDGGGLLLDLGAHLVDSAVQLFGPVATVRAELRALTTPTEDDVFLALGHASGTTSHLWAGGLVGAPGPRTRVLGSAGAYLVTSFEGEPTPFAALDPGEGMEGWLVHGDSAVPVPREPGGHVDFYRGVAAWLAGGAIPVDPRDAVHTAAVLDAARLSAASRRDEPVQPGQEPVQPE